MPFAYVHEFDVGADRSTTNYDAIGAKLHFDQEPPEGLVLHAAGFAGDKFRLIEIWESAELQRFERDRLMPAVLEIAGEDGTAPTTTSYQLHNLVAGRR